MNIKDQSSVLESITGILPVVSCEFDNIPLLYGIVILTCSLRKPPLPYFHFSLIISAAGWGPNQALPVLIKFCSALVPGVVVLLHYQIALKVIEPELFPSFGYAV